MLARFFVSQREQIPRSFRSSVQCAAALLLLRTCTTMSTNTSPPSPSNRKQQKIAVAQVCATHCKLHNLVNAARTAGWAKRQDCKMLFLPECFGFLGTSAAQTLHAAEKKEGAVDNPARVSDLLIQTVHDCAKNNNDHTSNLGDALQLEETDDLALSLLDGLKTIAKASNMWISGGSMHVACQEEDGDNHEEPQEYSRVYNRHVIVDSAGLVRAEYNKIHLFDVCIPGKVDLRESKTTRAGKKLVVVRADESPVGGCMGVTVCYDLRFPEMYVQLVQDMGAEILLVPSAFTVPTGKAHWHTLLQARAIENQCYVIAAAQYGPHNSKRTSYGHSLVVDPWGTVIADAGGMDSPDGTSLSTPSIVTAEIDYDFIASIRERMPIQQHRSNSAAFC